MGLFGLGKKKNVLDLSERYKKQQEKASQMIADSQETKSSPSQTGLGFLGNLANAASNSETQSENYVDVSEGVVDKRKKLAKRFLDMTTKIEDLSNQIYHLNQRIEVLEKKSGIGSY